MPDSQNPGQTTTSQTNVLTQNFNTLQTVINYGADAIDGKATENKFALQSDLNSLTKKANDLQDDLDDLQGEGTGSVQSQISSALKGYAKLEKSKSSDNVYTISVGSGESQTKASFVSPRVYAGSGDIVALAYGRNVTVSDGVFASGSISVVKPTNANQMLVSTTGGQGLKFREIPTTVTTNIEEEANTALVDINVAASADGDSAVISGTHRPFVNAVTISGTGNVVTNASVSNNILTMTKGATVLSSVADRQTGESFDSSGGDVAIKSISKSGSALNYVTTKVVTPSQLSDELSDYWQKFDVGSASDLKDYIDNADSGLRGRIDTLEDTVGSDDAGGSLTSRVKTLETNYSTLTGGDTTAKLSDYMKSDAITISVSGGTLKITVKE